MKRIDRCSRASALLLIVAGWNTSSVLAAQNGEKQPPSPPATPAPSTASEPSGSSDSANTASQKPNGSPTTKENHKKKRALRFQITPTTKAFLPQSPELRHSFGDTWVSYGISFRGPDLPKDKAEFDFQPELISSSGHGNRITLVMPELRYRMAVSNAAIRPFIGIEAMPVFAQTRVTSENLPSRWRGGFGGGLTGGIAFSNKGLITVGYQWTDTIRGFNLSGAKAGLSYRF